MIVSAPNRTVSIFRRALSPIVAVALALTVPAGCGDSSFDVADVEAGADAGAEHSYLIPAGTGAAKDAGELVEILPADLTVRVGEVLELINEDDRGHIVGPFYVRAGETLRQEFTSTGVYEGVCTVHPSGQVKVTVVEG
jgi:plastocyanin